MKHTPAASQTRQRAPRAEELPAAEENVETQEALNEQEALAVEEEQNTEVTEIKEEETPLAAQSDAVATQKNIILPIVLISVFMLLAAGGFVFLKRKDIFEK